MPQLSTNENNNINSTISVTTKLSLLWLVVMFNMIYADILAFISAFITPGVIDELMRGYSGTVKLSQELLLVSAVLIELPIIMIVLAKMLPYKINRLSNIFVALVTITFVGGGIETDPFFLFMASIEIIVMIYIIWTALNWKQQS